MKSRTTKPRAKPAPQPVNVRFPPELGAKLDGFARLTESPRSTIVVRAVEEYLAWRLPQQEDLRRILATARTEKRVDNAEVIAWLEGFIAKHEG